MLRSSFPADSAAPSAPGLPAGRCVVVDDDRRAASETAQWLTTLGWHASAAGSADEAIAALGRGRCDACLLDADLPDAGGRRVAAVLRAAWPAAGLIGFSRTGGHGVGADVSLRAPWTDVELLAALDSARQGRRGPPLAVPVVNDGLVADDSSMRDVLEVVRRVADTPATILLTGESGTGKSRLARNIHQASRRRNGRFVEVACGCLHESLLESELFGHVAGAFTGATTHRAGRFRQADGGTLFLDEIATATPALQVKLLRVLQDLAFEPVGGTETEQVDVRLILATHEKLDQLVAAGRFREDLYWRINVVAIELPPLRERLADIPRLARHFLARAAAKVDRAVHDFSAATLDRLLAHDWPGNVRELEHAIERAVLLGSGPVVEPSDLPPRLTGSGRAGTPRDGAATLKDRLAAPERQLILDTLERHRWRRDAAARALGINRATLYKKAKRLGVDLASLPTASAS